MSILTNQSKCHSHSFEKKPIYKISKRAHDIVPTFLLFPLKYRPNDELDSLENLNAIYFGMLQDPDVTKENVSLEVIIYLLRSACNLLRHTNNYAAQVTCSYLPLVDI